MAEAVNIYDAKTHFSQLVSRVEAGEEITLARNGRPVARIVPIDHDRRHRQPGIWRGRVEIDASFDEFTVTDGLDWYGR